MCGKFEGVFTFLACSHGTCNEIESISDRDSRSTLEGKSPF